MRFILAFFTVFVFSSAAFAATPYGTYLGQFAEAGDINYVGQIRITYKRSETVTATQYFPNGTIKTVFRFYPAIGKMLATQYINGIIEWTGNGTFVVRNLTIKFTASLKTLYGEDGLTGKFVLKKNYHRASGRFRTAFSFVTFDVRHKK